MPDPIFPGRLGLYTSMLVYALRNTRDFAVEHVNFYREFRNWYGDVTGRRILDFGCGKTFWLTLLLASDGADAIGVDTQLAAPERHLSKYWGLLRTNGLERAMRTLAWDFGFAARYYRCLEEAFGQSLHFDRVQVDHIHDNQVPVANYSLDAVVSHEVLEHVRDLPAVFSNLRRALKPDGVAYLYVHQFTSLSGGHHIAWKHPDTAPSRRVAPWDHLRGRNHAHIPSWLNETRAAEYRRMMEVEFEILDWRWLAKEGEALLTPAIRNELAAYNEQELLHKGFIAIARPHGGN